jgi:hypothetical protein
MRISDAKACLGRADHMSNKAQLRDESVGCLQCAIEELSWQSQWIEPQRLHTADGNMTEFHHDIMNLNAIRSILHDKCEFMLPSWEV